MKVQVLTTNFSEKKHSKKIEIKRHAYVSPVTGHEVAHGEEIWFRPNGMIKETSTWTHGKKDGLDIMNYTHTGNFDKRYLFRTFTAGIPNGIEVFFLKH